MGIWCVFNYFVRQWEGTISWNAVALTRKFLEDLRIKRYLIRPFHHDPFITVNVFLTFFAVFILHIFSVSMMWLIFGRKKKCF